MGGGERESLIKLKSPLGVYLTYPLCLRAPNTADTLIQSDSAIVSITDVINEHVAQRCQQADRRRRRRSKPRNRPVESSARPTSFPEQRASRPRFIPLGGSRSLSVAAAATATAATTAASAVFVPLAVVPLTPGPLTDSCLPHHGGKCSLLQYPRTSSAPATAQKGQLERQLHRKPPPCQRRRRRKTPFISSKATHPYNGRDYSRPRLESKMERI